MAPPVQGDKPQVVHPELFKQIRLADLNNDQRARQRAIEASGASDPGAEFLAAMGVSAKVGGLQAGDERIRALDNRDNPNGVADHTDVFVKDGAVLDGRQASGFLSRLCEEAVPHQTQFFETPEAKANRQQAGVGIAYNPGGKSEEMRLPDERRSVNSAGGYVEDLQGCNYNRDGIHLEAAPGGDADEVVASYEDAQGESSVLFNLKSGEAQPLPATEAPETKK